MERFVTISLLLSLTTPHLMRAMDVGCIGLERATGTTELFEAIDRGKLDHIKSVIKGDRTRVNQTLAHGESPLDRALHCYHHESTPEREYIVCYLLELGAKPAIKSFSYMVHTGNPGLIKMLIERGTLGTKPEEELMVLTRNAQGALREALAQSSVNHQVIEAILSVDVDWSTKGVIYDPAMIMNLANNSTNALTASSITPTSTSQSKETL